MGFFGLTKALSTPADWASSVPEIFSYQSYESGSRDWVSPVAIKKEHGELLGVTYNAVREALDGIYKKGHQDGRNLLNSLVSGTITEDEFNNRAARIDGS